MPPMRESNPLNGQIYRAIAATIGRILLVGLLTWTSTGQLPGAEIAALRAAATSITSNELRSHIDVLADDSFEGREAGSRGGQAAAGYLVRQLESRSLRPAGDSGTYFQSFGQGFRNILAMLEGSDPDLRSEVVILGAHYDHVGYGTQTNSYGPWGYIHNGADDNASGVSGLLETIDALLAVQPPPKRSVLFAFFDGEEKGLLGSKHWIARPTVPRERIMGMINVDMIGRMQQDRIEVYGTRSAFGLRRMVSECNELTRLKLDFIWEMKENSDHYPFFAQRIPTLMVHTGLHGDYHRPSDDVERLNAAGMQEAARFLFAVVYEMSVRPAVGPFRATAFQEQPGHKDLLERVLGEAPPRLGVVWQKPGADQTGLVVQDVTHGSPAQRAGIRRGDRLLKFRGSSILDPERFRLEILAAPSATSLTVQREGSDQPLDLPVELAGSPTRIGISWKDDDAEPGTVLLTQVVHGSAAHQAGLSVRDRIYAVSGKSFRDSRELRELLTTHEAPLELLVERDGQLRVTSLNVLPRGGNRP
ncbi:MAG: M20/M25/M40 family metallo-hydrolase [Pirellulaceae bacterium]